MKFLRPLILVLVIGAFGVGAWVYFGGGPDVEADVVMSKDVGFVAAIDFSDSGQRAQVNEFGKLFDDISFKDEIDYPPIEEALSITPEEAERLGEIIKGKWKLMMGFEVVNDDFDFDMIEDAIDNGDVVMYAAAKFEEADLVEKWFLEAASQEYAVTHVDGVTVFEVKENQEKFFRYGDLFFFVSVPERQDEVVARVKSGVSEFVLPSTIPEENLGYMFADGEKFPKYRDYLYSQFGQPNDEDVLKGAYFYAYADDGIRVSGELELDGAEEDMGLFVTGNDYELNLVDKVPGDGTILYYEDASLASLITRTALAADGTIDRLEGGDGGVDYSYLDTLDKFAGNLNGVSRENLDVVFDSPYAVSFAYSEGLLPNLGIYVQLDEEDLGAAGKVISGLSGYFEEVISEFDAMIVSELGADAGGGIVMESTAVRGGGAHKIYLDWDKMPAEFLAQAQFVPGFDFKDLNLELYYGVTGDNVFFITFYPDFEDAYGENVFGDSKIFKEAVSFIGDEPNVVGFADFRPFVGFAKKYFDLFGVVMEADVDEFKKNVTQVEEVLSHFPYFVYSSSYRKGMAKIGAYLRIE